MIDLFEVAPIGITYTRNTRGRTKLRRKLIEVLLEPL